MEPAEVLAAAREGLEVMAERYARLVEELDDLSAPIPGSEWTVRDAAVHLTGHGHRYAALAAGESSLASMPVDKTKWDARARSLIADNPETDPKKLAEQIRDGYGHLLEVTATLPAEHQVDYFGGLRPTLAVIMSLVLGEPILHGYDIATAVGRPWPIDPGQAVLPLGAYRLGLPAMFQPPASAGLEATYHLDIVGADPLFVRIADGSYKELPATPSVDCVISADAVTALLVISRRLSKWPAIALGTLSFAGEHPEIGPGFFDAFIFP